MNTRTGEAVTVGATSIPRLLDVSRFEIVPLDGVREAVLEHVPRDVTLTVTVSPVRGLEPSLDLTEALTRDGYAVVPHVSARLVRDRSHLTELAVRLHAIGTRDVFVVGGDAAEPAGAYAGAAALLRDLRDVDAGVERIGIAGYPERHPLMDDATAWATLAEKAPFASYVVTQICFDPRVTMAWVADLRARGIDLPVYVGIPGAVKRAKLLRVSSRIGIGESIRFLRKHGNVVTRFLRPGAIRPDHLVGELAIDGPATRIAGFHVFTFNDLEDTMAWRATRIGAATS